MLRKSDYVFRFGGDEFIVLLSFLAHDEDVAIVVKKLSCLLDSPVRVENRDVFITMSAGIAFYPSDGDNANQLLKNADTGAVCRQEKRNCLRIFSCGMEERAREKIEVINDLHVAIDRGEFFLNYQPLFSGRGDLWRRRSAYPWRHPEKGMYTA
jgi:predicted signal transduction protein with EAL and GGDEF domain